MDWTPEMHQEIEKLDSNDPRKVVYDSSKRFKTNWIELGEHLSNVATEKLYEGWGYQKFEDYCLVELKLKKNMAIKLTNAFFFVTNENLTDKGLDLDVVSVLKKAKDDENCPSEVFEELRDIAVKGRSGATVQKAYKEGIQEKDDETKNFYRKSQSMADQLLARINPVDDVPARFRESLIEMSEFFGEQINYVGVK